MSEPVPREELEALRARIEAVVAVSKGEMRFARVAPWLLLAGMVLTMVVSLGGAFYPYGPEAFRPALTWMLGGSGAAGAVALVTGFVGIRISQRRAVARLRRATRTTLAGIPPERLVDALCLGMEGETVAKVRADLLRQLGAPPSEPVPAGEGDGPERALLTPSEPRRR